MKYGIFSMLLCLGSKFLVSHPLLHGSFPSPGLPGDHKLALPRYCGAMYPCSNVELVAAVSEAGGIGIVQPVTLAFVHGMEFREGLRRVRALTARPIGMNALIEKSSRRYLDRMRRWVDEA